MLLVSILELEVAVINGKIVECTGTTRTQIVKFFYDYVAHSKPSTRRLLPFVSQLAPNWYELGAMLLEEEQEAHLIVIQSTYGSDPKKCCLSMLQYWMNTHPKATWHQLVTALRSPGVELAAVASNIEKNFAGKMVDSVTYVLTKFELLSIIQPS